MLRKALLLTLISFLLGTQVFGYRNKKAILLAEKEEQPDSIGYNIVEEMGRYVYQWVKENKVSLWDSPEKKYHIGFNDLQGIESSTKTAFSNLRNLFIYETWTSSRRKFSFDVKGFSFANID